MAFEHKINQVGSTQVVVFQGKITTDADLENLKKTLENSSPNLVFDLSELTHTNSSGINFFIKSLTRCRVNGGELILSGLNGGVRKLFELAKIDGLFTIYDTVEDSINHFNNN